MKYHGLKENRSIYMNTLISVTADAFRGHSFSLEVMDRITENKNNERHQLKMPTIDQKVPEDHLVRKHSVTYLGRLCRRSRASLSYYTIRQIYARRKETTLLMRKKSMVCVGNLKRSQKIVHARDAYFCCHEFKQTRYLDMARNTNSVIVLLRDTDFT